MKPGVKGGGASGRVAVQGNGNVEDEPPTDPGSRTTHQSYTEKDYEGTFFFFFVFILWFFKQSSNVKRK